MAEIVAMPKLGLLMETGTVGAWKVAEGDYVTVGHVIAEITTEKIVYELESQVEGTLLKIILDEDGEAPVGDPIALIGQAGEDISAFGGVAPAAAATAAAARRRHQCGPRASGSWPLRPPRSWPRNSASTSRSWRGVVPTAGSRSKMWRRPRLCPQAPRPSP